MRRMARVDMHRLLDDEGKVRGCVSGWWWRVTMEGDERRMGSAAVDGERGGME